MNYELLIVGIFGVGCFVGGYALCAHIHSIAAKAATAATTAVNRATTLPAGTPVALSDVAKKFATAVDATIADIAKAAGATPPAATPPAA